MATKKERRTGSERRGTTTDPSRKRERRMGDRRDSPRIPITLQVRDGAGEFRETQGDLSVGGAYFVIPQTPSSNQLDLKFKLPGVRREIKTAAEVLRIGGYGGRVGVHVKFTEIETQDELAVAKFIDDHILQVP